MFVLGLLLPISLGDKFPESEILNSNPLLLGLMVAGFLAFGAGTSWFTLLGEYQEDLPSSFQVTPIPRFFLFLACNAVLNAGWPILYITYMNRVGISFPDLTYSFDLPVIFLYAIVVFDLGVLANTQPLGSVFGGDGY